MAIVRPGLRSQRFARLCGDDLFGQGEDLWSIVFRLLLGEWFLPTRFQGVRFRGVGDPVPYLNNRTDRPGLASFSFGWPRDAHRNHLETVGDPEIETRIAQYEMAFRMQTSVPGLLDFRDEPQHFWIFTDPRCTNRVVSPDTV